MNGDTFTPSMVEASAAYDERKPSIKCAVDGCNLYLQRGWYLPNETIPENWTCCLHTPGNWLCVAHRFAEPKAVEI